MTLRPLYVNGRFLTQRITGTQRYAREILDRLDAMLVEDRANADPDSTDQWPEIEVLVPRHDGALPKYKQLRVRTVGRRTGRAWEQAELPFYAWAGVLFTPCGGAPILHRRNVITVHDAGVYACPNGYATLYRIWYRWLYRALCRSALHVFTVSQFSKSELIKYCGADKSNMSVTYLGSEHASREAPDRRILHEYGIRPNEYVFTVSSRAPNKNIDGLLAAFGHFGDCKLDLAVAGAKNVRIFPATSEVGSAAIDLGYISEPQLRTLYENAACFVFPSLYEGFGLPPLEAMALGCPAVVSRTSSLGEIFGPIAFLCDPLDPRDIAAKIKEASQSSAEYRERCRQFARGFRWDRCAQKTWRTIAELCAPELCAQEQTGRDKSAVFYRGGRFAAPHEHIGEREIERVKVAP